MILVVEVRPGQGLSAALAKDTAPDDENMKVRFGHQPRE